MAEPAAAAPSDRRDRAWAALVAAACFAVFVLSPIEQSGDLPVRPWTAGQERLLAALLTAAAAAVFFAIARVLLPRGASALVALAGALATPAWSTASRALWSHTWALLPASLGVLLLLRAWEGTGRTRPVLLGILWTAAFLARPPFAISLAGVFVLLLSTRRRELPAFAATVGGGLALLVAGGRAFLGTWWPQYYAPRDVILEGAMEAALGTWLSPSRGLVLYVPVVAFVLYASLRYPPRPALRPLRLLAAAVIAAHTLLVATDPLWWGGHCYGPRVMTDLVPWLVLLAVLALDGRPAAGAPRSTLVERFLALAAIAVGIVVHARGALSPATQEWNYRPRSVDVATARLWDWRHPQALAGWLAFAEADAAPALAMGQPVDLRRPENEAYLGEGWSGGERDQRWGLGPAAELAFRLPGTSDAVLRLEAEPFLVEGRLAEQAVDVELNGHPVGHWRLRSSGLKTYSVRLPRSLQAPQDRVRLLFPHAASPRRLGRGDDPRLLAIAVRTMRADPLPLLNRGRAVDLANEDADAYLGAGWGAPEEGHRWTEGPQAEMWFAAQDAEAAVLRLSLSPFVVPAYRERQRVRIDLNGSTAAELELTHGAFQTASVLLPRGTLAADNLLRLSLPDAPTSPPPDPAIDPRPLGVALRTVALEDLPRYPPGGAIDPQSESATAFLLEGWDWLDGSRPSPRWALGPRARIAFALDPPAARVMRLELTPMLEPPLTTQPVELELNGLPLARLELRVPGRDEYPIALPPGALARHNVLTLGLPQARSPRSLGLGDDPRRLGVVVHGLRLE